MYNDDEERRKSDEEYMRGLYDRFRGEVDSGRPAEYYEVDELLDIYDYAQDEGDLLVQFFVFLAFSRLYPERHDFDERMAFFLSYVSSDAANEMVMRQGREETPLWDVLKMGVKCYPDGDPSPFLTDILSRYDRLDTETILKIVDLLKEMNRQELLATYYDALLAKAEDKKMLAFEVVDTIKEVDALLPRAREIAEELTKMDPFYVDAWLLLARVEFALEHAADALAACDYALAIDPKNANALITRAVVLVGMPERLNEAVEALEEILRVDPDNQYAIEGLARANALLGNKDRAASLFGRLVAMKGKIQPTATDPLTELLRLEPRNLDMYIQLAVEAGFVDEDEWVARVGEVAGDNAEYAARIVGLLHEILGLRKQLRFYLIVLYSAGEFEQLTSVFEKALSDMATIGAHSEEDFDLADFALLAAAYLRSGRRDMAGTTAKSVAAASAKNNGRDNLMWLRGVNITARLIEQTSQSELTDAELRNFDPLADFPAVSIDLP